MLTYVSGGRTPPLAEACPDLADQWHHERNAPLTPAEVTCGLGRKVWWTCPQGHEYEAAISHRARNGSGCPYCSNRRVLAGFNDLATTHPDLAREWHPTGNGTLTPQTVIAGANKKRWWQCSAGHEWEALSSHRAGPRRIGCPYCSRRRTVPGATDLAYTHPRLAAEWHPSSNGDLRPDDVSAGSDRPVWWLCPLGHDYRAAPSARSRRSGASGCPVCAGRIVLAGFNDLPTTHPDLATEWHPTLNGPAVPRDISRGSRFKAWWRCGEGHAWQQAVASRTRRGTGCPGCEQRRAVMPGVNDLATTHPRLAEQWHPERNGILTPAAVTAGSTERIWWRCERAHEWDAVCYSRTSGKPTGCPFCGNKRVLVGFNDLGTTHPALAAEWHPGRNGALQPQGLVSGSNHRAWWQCHRGHEWQSIVSSRRDGTRSCPICSGAQVLPGYNDLATAHPRLAAQWHHTRNGDLAPDRVAPGSGSTVWWRCDLDHEWRAAVHSRTGPLATGCPYCSNKAVLAGYNDLASTHPDLAAQWHPTRNGALLPEQVTAGTARKVWWLCPAGHEWAATGSNRARLGVGCPDCAPVGFHPNSPAATYVVTDDVAHKIGVMGWDYKRLARHRQLGWRLVRVWRFSAGHDAYALEQAVVRRLREELRLAVGYSVAQMPQGGATETVSAHDLSLAAFCELVDGTRERLGLLVHEDEQHALF